MVGMAKKLLIANNLGQLWDACLAGTGGMSVAGAWLGAAAFSLHLYFDFSGYSDMAIGLGRMLGFEFLPNFDHPYVSRSITEFWRRWHISLGTWFKEYLYIPLGGSRVGHVRRYVNLLLVWGATGLWHGASWNYLIWGLYFGVLLVLEKRFWLDWLGRHRVFSHVYTLLLVVVSWAIFAIEDFGQLGQYLRVMFGLGGVPVVNSAFGYYLMNYLPSLVIACVAATPAGLTVYGRLPEKKKMALSGILVAGGLVVCTAYLVASTYNPFLYFRF